MLLEFQQKVVESELTRRSLTHSAWDLSSSKSNERRGWHPMTYKFSDATPQLIQSIKVTHLCHFKRIWVQFLISDSQLSCGGLIKIMFM